MPDPRDFLPPPPWEGPPVPRGINAEQLHKECTRKPLKLITIAYRFVDGADYYLIENKVAEALDHIESARRYVVSVGKPELCYELDNATRLINEGNYHDAFHALERGMDNIALAAFKDVVKCECGR